MTTLYVYKSQCSGWTYLYYDEAGRRVDGPNGIDGRTEALLLGCHRVSPSQVRFGRPSDFPEEADLLSTQCELKRAKADLAELTQRVMVSEQNTQDRIRERDRESVKYEKLFSDLQKLVLVRE